VSRVSPTVILGLHAIALPTPFPVGDVNVYLAEGDPLTLIDCGASFPEGSAALREALTALGYTISDLKRLIITHHHADHMGLTAEIVRESGAQVVAHPLAARWLATPLAMRDRAVAFAADLWRSQGVPDELIAEMARDNAYFSRFVQTHPATTTLDEGDTIGFAGHVWQVLHTPGHAGDLLCFYQPESGVLLASDHVIGKISSNPLVEAPPNEGDPRPRRLVEYLYHLDRVAALRVEVAYAGHGTPVTGLPELIAGRRVLHQTRAAAILALLADGPKNVYALARLMFPQVRRGEWYLVFSEVLGHLDLLEVTGRAAPRPDPLHPDQVLWAAC